MALLEEGGWLSELTAPIAPGLNVQRPKNLLAATSDDFDLAKAREILGKLEALIDRVADAIDES